MTGRTAAGVDVAIVGGGIVGAATAAFLAGAGVRARLYERGEIAAAASGRNSGVIQHPFDPLLAALYLESLGLYRELAEASETAAPFRLRAQPAGLLAVEADGGDATRQTAAAWRAAYPESRPELLSGTELAALEPELAEGVVACRLAIGYPVAPASATRAFADLAERRGAEIRLGTEVGLAVRRGMAVGVEIDGRVEGADAVVVAAGPWTPQLIDPTGAWRPIRPVWGVVAAVELERPPSHVLEEASIDIEPDTEAPPPAGSAAPGGVGFSLVTADGSSALGSTFLDDERDPQSLVEELRARGSRFVPSLAATPVVGLRSCARPVALDKRPLVGRVPGLENAFLAAGHGPWGISTGPATARMIADLVTGRVPTIPAGLDPARFGPIER